MPVTIKKHWIQEGRRSVWAERERKENSAISDACCYADHRELNEERRERERRERERKQEERESNALLTGQDAVNKTENKYFLLNKKYVDVSLCFWRLKLCYSKCWIKYLQYHKAMYSSSASNQTERGTSSITSWQKWWKYGAMYSNLTPMNNQSGYHIRPRGNVLLTSAKLE